MCIRDRFHADQLNHKWVTDISYIHTNQGVLYLSLFREDVYKRQGQDYSVPALLVPAHGHRPAPELRAEEQLHARIAGVYIRM